MLNKNLYIPAEWDEQDAILMAFPHKDSDWAYMLEEARNCFTKIIKTITSTKQHVILIVNDDEDYSFANQNFNKYVHPAVIPFNDTWTRDYGPIFVKAGNNLTCIDFKFNGWGLKFAADKDNLVNGHLSCYNIFDKEVEYQNKLNFVLEGGSIESDGKGTILTTSECLLSPNRNGEWNRFEIKSYLKKTLGANRILWLNNGKLIGDDTDGHIDTLARFCDDKTITYVKCTNKDDQHYLSLYAMEEELKSFVDSEGKHYKLVPLPLPYPILCDGKILPATYCNFLIINKAVLVPIYKVSEDKEALKIISSLFPNRKIIGIDCRTLIKQYGSLHCATMQLPKGSLSFFNFRKK